MLVFVTIVTFFLVTLRLFSFLIVGVFVVIKFRELVFGNFVGFPVLSEQLLLVGLLKGVIKGIVEEVINVAALSL
jgi:hypothetical protein